MLFENSDLSEGAWSQRRAIHFKKVCFLRILTPRRDPGHKEGLFISKRGSFLNVWTTRREPGQSTGASIYLFLATYGERVLKAR